VNAQEASAAAKAARDRDARRKIEQEAQDRANRITFYSPGNPGWAGIMSKIKDAAGRGCNRFVFGDYFPEPIVELLEGPEYGYKVEVVWDRDKGTSTIISWGQG
jgi:hypothetical protein